MRTKLFSYAMALAMAGTLCLTTGCKNFHWPWQKNRTQNVPPPLPDGEGIPGMERPAIGAMDRSHFAAQIVYFDYDSAKIKPSEVSKLQVVASFMKNAGKNLIIEGHTDERGTAEYNRALGERRAQAAREELIHMGVNPARISTNSYGKDRPADPSHDDTAWSRNRRCEFVLVGQ